jgi:predicted nucleotidyltransferase
VRKLEKMLKKLLKNKKFKSEINKLIKEKEEIVDIVLFGSVIRGKDKPNDIDILIIFNKKENLETSYILRKRLEKLGLKVNITTKSYDSLTSGDFKAKEDILSQGYSIAKNDFLSESFGYSNFILFKYSLTEFSNSKRIRFHYSLRGRYGNKGIIKELNAIKFSDSILLSTIQNSEEMKDFLELWGVNFVSMPILIPTRSRKLMLL